MHGVLQVQAANANLTKWNTTPSEKSTATEKQDYPSLKHDCHPSKRKLTAARVLLFSNNPASIAIAAYSSEPANDGGAVKSQGLI